METWDVATPLTTERYTRVGQPYALPPRPISMMRARPMPVPGLEGLQIVGQSVGGAEIPGCVVMGRNAIAALT